MKQYKLMHLQRLSFFLLLAAWLTVAGCAASQETATVVDRPAAPVEEAPAPPVAEAPPAPSPLDTVTVGRFDTGKMWTFDNPPVAYFEETYDFDPDSAWFAKMRLGALRIPGCTASFVSPNGLILTNHHCAREAITGVTRAGENLLDNGFYASSLEAERAYDEMYAEQLIGIRDVTAEVYAGTRDADNPGQARERKAQALQERLTSEAKQRDSTLTVEVIELYDGGKYSAYTFRRYEDVRLVLAPELKLGAFGGDPDNFTYPRYSLDYSFFRIYEDGEPLDNAYFFRWSENGAQPGEPVFIVGNPGSTSRLNTVSQLLYERDYNVPQTLDVLRTRSNILQEYIQANPALADTFDLRNTRHSLENTVKKLQGELEGLRDPYLIARRRAAEEQLQEAIAGVDTLQEQYGDVFAQIEAIQRSKQAMARQAGAFTYFAAPIVDSHVLVRSVYGYIYSVLKQRGAPAEQLQEIRKEALAVEDWPAEVEEAFLTARLRELQEQLGTTDPTINRILKGRTPAEAAEQIIAGTALVDSARYAQLLEEGYLDSGDPSVPLAEALTPLYFSLSQQITGFETREEDLNAQLARARFALYGTRIPPDATFSLRVADGIVKGYPYNGTVAPPHTTFFGLYNHYFSYGKESEWDLPVKWIDPPATFDRATPLNLVSTNDITGGNSGSPLLNRELEIVGVAFDSNIDALPNTYLYSDLRGRAISVDSRGILESLDDIYDADRLVLELRQGTLAPTEAEADAELEATSR